MFENLTEKLQRVFKNLRGQGKLTEEHLDAAVGQIREALLDGDVNVGVADELLAKIRAKAQGAEVMLQLSPDQQVVKIVRDELTELLGKHARPLFSSRPPSVWLIVGLQGSGKTTTTGKLAKWLSSHGHRPLVVSTDVYRPAAREQLAQVARAIGLPCWAATGTDKPLEIVRGAIREAKLSAYDVILVDTAGRLHIDNELMTELGELKRELQPAEILFIVDAKKAAELERKLRRNEFTLEDFRDQLRQLRKMGPLEQIIGMLPKLGPLANLPKDAQVDEGRLKRVEAIINSMTAAEREDHSLIDGKRRKRIASGSGTSVQEVNQVLKQYMQMRKMIKQFGPAAAKGKLRGLGKLSGLS